MAKIGEGDLVRLKCGGPDMIVVALTPAYVPEHATPIPNAFCIFEEERRFFERSYPLYALDIIQKDRRLSVRPVSTYTAETESNADDDASAGMPADAA